MYEAYETWLGKQVKWDEIKSFNDLQELKDIARRTARTEGQKQLFRKYWGTNTDVAGNVENNEPIEGKALTAHENIIRLTGAARHAEIMQPDVDEIRSLHSKQEELGFKRTPWRDLRFDHDREVEWQTVILEEERRGVIKTALLPRAQERTIRTGLSADEIIRMEANFIPTGVRGVKEVKLKSLELAFAEYSKDQLKDLQRRNIAK